MYEKIIVTFKNNIDESIVEELKSIQHTQVIKDGNRIAIRAVLPIDKSEEDEKILKEGLEKEVQKITEHSDVEISYCI